MLTTGIGSLPFLSIEEALEYSFKHDLPFLPQLPQFNEDEMMVTQAMDSTFETYACFDPFLYACITRNIKKAKLQIAGPLTCSLILEIPIAGVVNRLLTKVEMMTKPFIEQQIEPVFFIDEPMLFASFDNSYFEYLNKFFQKLKSYKIKVGIHCCSRANWDFVGSLALDYVSVDTSICNDFSKFKKSKLVMGIDPRRKIQVDLKLADYVSYTCGMGSLSINDTNEILQKLKDL